MTKPRPVTPDEQQCIDALQDWLQQVRDLLEFIGPATYVKVDKDEPDSQAWVKEARTRLETLKRELVGESASIDRRGLTAAERQFYARPIHSAAASLTLKPQETDGDIWRGELGSILSTLDVGIGRITYRPPPVRKSTAS